jgi:hypothetical protein
VLHLSICETNHANDDAAENVLVETFLEVCSDLGGYQADERVRLRLVTIAVREASSTLHSGVPGHPVLDRVADTYEDWWFVGFPSGEMTINNAIPGTPRPCVLEHRHRSLDPCVERRSCSGISKILQSSTSRRS